MPLVEPMALAWLCSAGGGAGTRCIEAGNAKSMRPSGRTRAGSPGKLAVERLDGVRKLHTPLLIGGASELVRLLRAEAAVTTGCGLLSRPLVRRGKERGWHTFGDGPLPASEARRFISRARCVVQSEVSPKAGSKGSGASTEDARRAASYARHLA